MNRVKRLAKQSVPPKVKKKKGGPRLGSGRPGKPVSAVRRNRLVLLVTDQELADLRGRAAKATKPPATLAHEYLCHGLYGFVRIAAFKPPVAEEAR